MMLRLIGLLLLISGAAGAQQIKVSDKSGKPVPEVLVIVTEIDNGKQHIYFSDNHGEVKVESFLKKVQILTRHLAYFDHTDTLETLTSNLAFTLEKRDISLDEVVVTSQYTSRTGDQSVASVDVITRQQIENQAATNLEQVLSQQLNTRISQDPVLGSGLTLNGLGGQNIKFLVDGVPVIGRLDGNIDVSQINMNNVERIEIVNGPMSAVYGTDAIGGVVNVITKNAIDKKYEAGANLFYENIGQYNVDGYSGINTGKSSFLVSGGRNFFDGWSAVDTSRVMEWKPKEQYFGNLKYRFVYKNLVLGYNFNAFHEKISNKGAPRISPYFAYAFDEYYHTIRYTNQLNASYILNRNESADLVIARSDYSRIKNTYRKDLVTLDQSIIPGSNDQDTTTFGSWMIRSSFNNYDEHSRLNYQAGIDFNREVASGSRFKASEEVMGDYAFYGSAEYKARSKWMVKPALRIAYNTKYKSPAVPSIFVKYDVAKNTQLRAAYGKGFRAPGIKELYLYFVDINHNIQGNENLLPEYSDNFYLAAAQKITFGKIKYDVELSGFYNDVRNLITLAQPDQTSSLYTYINLGKFSTHGVKLSNTFTYKSISASVGASYTGRYNIYADSGDFKKYIYNPDFNASVEYRFARQNFSVGVYFKYNGKLPGYKLNDDNSISQFTNDSYKFLDASVRKSFLKNRITVSGGVKNILNVTNISAFNQGSAHSAGSNEEAIGTGRSLFAKLQFQFGK